MTLTVCLLTYNRLEYAKIALISTLEMIQSLDKVNVHIADDGSDDGYVDELREIAGGYSCVANVGSSNSQRKGYGANFNLAMQSIHNGCDYVLPLEDDWEAMRPLCIDEWASMMSELGDCCIRLGYIGFTQELRSSFKFAKGNLLLKLDGDSPEPHVFAGHPRLETVGWQRSVGPWPEGLDPGTTEFQVAHRAQARHNVYCPMDIGSYYHHIGSIRSY